MLRMIESYRSALIAAFAVCFVIGCGGSSTQKYIPSTNLAKSALEKALGEWKSGKAHGTVTGLNVPIDVFDARWQAKKKLESYEVLREEKSDGPKIYVVKMKTDEDKEEKEVTYYVVGKSPLLIFREQDYKKATGTGG